MLYYFTQNTCYYYAMLSNRKPQHVITERIYGLVRWFSHLYSSLECLNL